MAVRHTTRIGIGLVGAGWIGRFHGTALARHIAEADLVAVADPAPAAARSLADELGVEAAYTDAADLLADPAVDAVVIAAPARFHVDLVVAAAAAGKAVFCEKPMGLSLADLDRAVAAADRHGVPLQVGFNRRFAADFAAARATVDAGEIGTVQLIRSLTRDPGLADPAAVPAWVIFNETLIHDFDTVCWMNPGAEPLEVYAVADALVAPDFKDRGLLDTAVVTITFDNGAIAVAEANFQAVYGYDVRGEVFGSGGMVTAGDVRQSPMRRYGAAGVQADTVRANVTLMREAYIEELRTFALLAGGQQVRPDLPGGADARRALAIAVAARRSVQEHRPVALADVLEVVPA